MISRCRRPPLTGALPIWLLAAVLFGAVRLSAAASAPSGWDQLPAILARIQPPRFPDRDVRITDYGAKEGGETDCRPAIQKAIAACSRAGGGRVIVPKGVWLCCGPIHLEDNVNLHVVEGATVRFSTRYDDYLPRVLTRWEGVVCYSYSPLIYAYRKTNVAVTGAGTLDGQASKAWGLWPDKVKPGTPDNEVLRDMGRKGVPVAERRFSCKPAMVEPYACRNVLVEGVTFRDYPFWCVHPTFCENVTVRRIRMISHNSNNDGVDPDSSRDVLIEDCYFDQSDDCLAIKAGRDQDAWRVGKPCENIVIRNMGPTFEGVAIGSECSGGVRNVFVYDCRYDSGNVLYCKSNLDRGGFIRNIFVRNLEVGEARIIRVRNDYHGYRGGNAPTEIRNIRIENVHIRQGSDETISIKGVEGAPVFDVLLKDIVVDAVRPPVFLVRWAENVRLQNVRAAGRLLPSVPPQAPPEEAEPPGTPSIAPGRSGAWSDVSIWETGRDGSGAVWTGQPAHRLPDAAVDERVLIGKKEASPQGVTLTLDCDIEGDFEVRVYEQSTFIIPEGRTLKIGGPLIVDRAGSVARQLGGVVDIQDNLEIDTDDGRYEIAGGALRIGGALSLNAGSLIIDDRRGTIRAMTAGGEFRTNDGEGGVTAKFIAHPGGVAPVQCRDLVLTAYLGEKLVVDVSAYDHQRGGDLVLFRYTGRREGIFDGGPEDPRPQVTVIGAQADLVYDDANKTVKLTNFR